MGITEARRFGRLLLTFLHRNLEHTTHTLPDKMSKTSWKCTHCFHAPQPEKRIPYYCGKHWYCSKHCYEDEMKNPHASHLLGTQSLYFNLTIFLFYPNLTLDLSYTHAHMIQLTHLHNYLIDPLHPEHDLHIRDKMAPKENHHSHSAAAEHAEHHKRSDNISKSFLSLLYN